MNQDGPSLIIEEPPPPPPQIAKDVNILTYEKLTIHCFSLLYICHILGLNFKFSYQIASLFDMNIDMGERIAEKQDRPRLIIEDPPPLRAHQVAQNINFLHFGP